MDKLKPIAEKLGVPLAQLALAWWAARASSGSSVLSLVGCETR